MAGRVEIRKWATITPNGLDIENPEPSQEEWLASVDELLTRHESAQWGLGDAYIYSRHLSDEVWQFIEGKRIKFKTLQNYASVCRKFPLARRRRGVSFFHHEVLAFLSVEKQDAWLDRCETEDLTIEELESLTAKERGKASPRSTAERLHEGYSILRAAYDEINDKKAKALVLTAIDSLEEAIRILEVKKGC